MNEPLPPLYGTLADSSENVTVSRLYCVTRNDFWTLPLFTYIQPSRLLPVFSRTEYFIVPFPVPVVVSRRIQVSDFDTVHIESDVTAIVPLPSSAVNVFAPGSSSICGFAACVTVCVAVSEPLVTVIVPVRWEPVFSRTEYSTVPLPLPLGVLTVIHDAVVVAVHE